MNYRKTATLIVFLFITTFTYSQVLPEKKDSIHEIIIYEVDTVYLKPDTIRQIDTIVKRTDNIKQDPKRNHNFFDPISRFFLSGNSFLSPLTPNSFSISVSPFLPGYFKDMKYGDTLIHRTSVNYIYSILWNYQFNKNIFSVGFGLTPVHEEFISTLRTSYGSINNSNQQAYDSIKYEYTNTYHQYYTYLNIHILYSRVIWTINNYWILNINLGISSSYMILYKQGTGDILPSNCRKIDLSGDIRTTIRYLIDKKFEFFIYPFYQQSFFNRQKFPKSTGQKIGLGLGFSLFLK